MVLSLKSVLDTDLKIIKTSYINSHYDWVPYIIILIMQKLFFPNLPKFYWFLAELFFVYRGIYDNYIVL